jgi:hypothetical protein
VDPRGGVEPPNTGFVDQLPKSLGREFENNRMLLISPMKVF